MIRRQLARLRAGLDLYGRVMHVILRAQLFAHFRHERVAGMPAGNDQMRGERGFDRVLSYFTIDDAMFGLSGFTSRVRVFGTMTRSISSIGIAPSKT
jgi:hypothetical protein